METTEFIRRCEELAKACEALERHAEGVSYPTGQAVLNAAANLYDAAAMAANGKGGAR